MDYSLQNRQKKYRMVLLLKKLPKILTLMVSVMFIPACDTGDDSLRAGETAGSENRLSLQSNRRVFSGCYTVDKSEPAQIKISMANNNLVMQMKEPKSAKRVWDDPEPLEILPVEKASNYFSINTNEITHLIARPDGLLAMAHINSAYKNMNPLLDSEYLGFILEGANTIFKVTCDDIYSDETSNDTKNYSHITIKSLPNSESQ